MPRHLPSCQKRKETVATLDREKGEKTELFHLRIFDSLSGDFWLDLEIRGSATLKDLDDYLRVIWLECCGHLSMFSTGGWGYGDEIPMRAMIRRALQPGAELLHIYDFGTWSETLVRSVAIRKGSPMTSNPIALMSRNNAPELRCIECGQPAVDFCIECMYESDTLGTLCERHSETHTCEDYGEPLPLVNSPRLGMCGYDGPAEPPY